MNGTTTFNRMPRIQEPLPQGEVKVPGPPTISPLPKFSLFQLLIPLAGVFVMVGVYGGVQGNFLLAVPMAAMSGLSVVGSIVGRLTQRKNHQKKIEEDEAAYAAALNQKRVELEQLRQEQQRIRTGMDPDLATLLARARNRDPRLWERRPEDADFLSVRLGIGDLPSTVRVSAPHPDMPDPRLEEAHALETEYATVPQVPVTTSIRTGPLGVAGPLPDRTGVVRALICNLAVHHSPDEVHLLAIFSPNRITEWQWLKWLPHTYALSDEAGRHYLANDSVSAEDVLKGLLEELHRRQNQLYAAQHGERTPVWPWLVLVVEDYALVRNDPAIHLLLSPEGRQLNATAVFMVDQAPHVPMGCSAVVESQANGQLRYSIAGAAGETCSCWPEYADTALSEQLVRSLAPVEVYTLQSDSAMPSNVRLLDMMSIKDIDRWDVARNWQRRSPGQYLTVPIGERRGNQPMVLDLNHTGHGPHGLIAGTTGSGKSELVQTLVVALALTHHPYDVGFVLVDFKGGGTFSDLVRLPHTLGMVTDLSGNLTERALVALEAEMDRRKRLFNDAGVNDITPYQDLYWQGKVKEPLPRLVVIIDEFAELVNDYPDFMDGLIGIARVGRSLGVHLILATQSPAGVVKQQIWANAKFRICLRVESRQESQEMLHRPEAANLPRVPGRGYLQVGNNDVFELFQVARVAGRYRTIGDTDMLVREHEQRVVISEISPLGQRTELFDSRKAQKQQKRAQTSWPTDIDMVVARLADVAEEIDIEKLPSPWPDPLPDHVALPSLLLREQYAGWDGAGWVFDRTARTPQIPPVHFCRACGEPLRVGAKFCGACGTPLQNRCRQCGSRLRPGARFCNSCGSTVAAVPSPAATSPPPPRSPTLSNRPWLGALLGLIDDPAHQRQFPLLLELGQQDAQLIAVGAPASGKEMWARTLITSLASTHTPDELHFYLLEFGGQALKVFENLPHVGGVFTPLDDERVRRLLLRLLDSLDERKGLCNRAGVDGLIRLRELQPGTAPPAIVVLVTGFMEFRTMFQNEMLQLMRLIREGGPYGIHIVLVGDRAGDIPTAISSVVARRVVLRLADADEYSIVLGTRLRVSKDQKVPPGRGWYGRPPLEFQTASPGHEGDENAQVAELQQIVDRMNRAWQGPRPEPVDILQAVIPLRQVLSRVPAPPPRPQQPQLAVPIGLDGVRLRPVLVDLVEGGPDFVVSSTPQGGKTTLLLAWALALAEFNSPQQVQFVLLAGRRNSLQSLEGLPHILDYCRTPEDFCQGGVLARLQAEIQRREGLLSGSIVRAGALPHVVVMMDDYDEFFNAGGGEREVQDGLFTLARRGRDVEIHTIVTGPLPNMGVGFNDSLVKQLKTGRSGFILRVLDANDQNPLGLRLRASEIKRMVPGRGYVVRNGSEAMLQVAMPGDSTSVAEWVGRLRQRWDDPGTPPASWPEEIMAAAAESEETKRR
jgi:S-DNA-T family DNA segregation ATPase FtsK/SpoIIIE